MVTDPMTTCGCCECIAAMLPSCNGVMTVGRDYAGDTPCGMKFTTLAGVMGVAPPLLVLWATQSTTSPRVNSSLVTVGFLEWYGCQKQLKEELRDRITARGAAMGVPDLFDKIADETVGITEEEILPSSRKKGIRLLAWNP